MLLATEIILIQGASEYMLHIHEKLGANNSKTLHVIFSEEAIFPKLVLKRPWAKQG